MKYFYLFSLLLSTTVISAKEKLLVVNKDGNDLSVIDTQTGSLIKTIKTGKGPHEVAVTSDQKQAIVTNYGYGCGP